MGAHLVNAALAGAAAVGEDVVAIGLAVLAAR
jgi:hypothetical protein